MIPLTITSSLSLSSPFLPPFHPKLSLTLNYLKLKKKKRKQVLELQRRQLCRAQLHQDAPFAFAIGACILNSLLFSSPGGASSEDEDTAMSSTDARFSVMTIISFIPYFNWLSWVFAAMDTGKRRYALYALVYLAPYLRTNLSLSPEESWLPIASIVLCVVHIQLEASIYSGDLIGFNFFSEASKRLGLYEHLEEMDEEETQGNMKLPLGKQSRDDIKKWRFPRKPSQDQHMDKDDEKH